MSRYIMIRGKKVYYKEKSETRSLSEKIVRAVATTVLLLWCIVLLYPLFFGLNGALKENGRAFMSNPVSLVFFTNPKWGNFIEVFDVIKHNDVSFFSMMLNSLFFAMVPTAVSIFFTALIGYCVSKYGHKYRILRHIYSAILIIQFIPLYGTLPATYKLFHDLGFLNSYKMIIPSFGISFPYFLYTYAFFKAVSWNYAEAAFIDGAGHWYTFFKVMFPQVFPSVLVIFILTFIGSWNDFQTCLLYYSDKLPTLSYGIYVFYNKSIYMANQPIYFAACILVCIPSIVLYLVFQEKLMSSMMIGGLKG